jgi:hypothetical protein
MCQKNRPKEKFSKSQLRKAHQRKNEKGEMQLVCEPCTTKGVSSLELQCTDCHEWKHIDEFLKAQRKTPDIAVSIF